MARKMLAAVGLILWLKTKADPYSASHPHFWVQIKSYREVVRFERVFISAKEGYISLVWLCL